ncbi:MAG: hypothetical protein JWN70_2472 [Planctomycetaceae bacterium]|nr:hypothetical protein [Planctomycetaceae bacterium]
MSLIDHPLGNYRFLPGIAPYSCGVVSASGFEIVHVMLRNPVDYLSGFDRIQQYLRNGERPVAALCAIELRSPCPFTFPGFAAFNAVYAKVLENWGLFVEGVNPVARTNVAPEVTPPPEPMLYGFSFTRPTAHSLSPTFVVAGAGELPEGVLAAESIIAGGDVSPAGLRTKAQYVMDLMEQRLRGLGADWPLVTDVDIYTIHPLESFLRELILNRMRPADMHGVHWHYTRPPIEGIEFEMDLRGIRTEVRID